MTKLWLFLLPLLLSFAAPSGGGGIPPTAGEVLFKNKIVRGGPGDQFGRSVDVIGDLDDDGVPDLVVGATHDDDGGNNTGSFWVLFMNSDLTVKSSTKLSQVQNGLQGVGLGVNNQMGKDVTALGDLDGDGVEDIAVGAPSVNVEAERRVIICFMNTDGTVKSYTQIYRTTLGFGRALANMGDLDGDGVVDLMVGTAFGTVFLYYLNANGTVKSSQTYNQRLLSTPGFDSFYGVGVEPIGDWDGDGITDALIGDTAGEFNGVTDSGVLYISLVNASGFDKQEIPLYDGLPNLNANLPTYPNWGRDGALLGDIDGNGTPEIAVGCSEWWDGVGFEDSGAVFILFMNADNSVADFRRISRDSGNLQQNLPPFVEFGISTAPLGDFNGDGIGDLAVGARFDGSGSIFLLMLNDGTLEFPDASANATPTSGNAPLGVQFTDTSTGSVTGWHWDFGDGSTSTQQNPLHTYTTAGTYDVVLTVTGPGNMEDSRTYPDLVSVQGSSGPVADFSASRTEGLLPLTVQFTDLSVGSVTSWSWDFGDGTTSTLENPSHTYSTRGLYTVQLTATSAGGSDSVTLPNLVRAGIVVDDGASGLAPEAGLQGDPPIAPEERHGLEHAVLGDLALSTRDIGSVQAYGCSSATAPDLQVHGAAVLGGHLVFELAQPADVGRMDVFVSTAPDAAFPCGTFTPRGETLIDWRTPSHRVARLRARRTTASETGLRVQLDLPWDASLVGLELFAQGLVRDERGETRLTGGTRIEVGVGSIGSPGNAAEGR